MSAGCETMQRATPDDAVHEPLLAVLCGVWAVDVQRLEHCVGQALRLKVLLNSNVTCGASSSSSGEENLGLTKVA
jgi:hypothetical protein